MGATAALGSLLDALVFRTLAVPSPGQLAALSAFDPVRMWRATSTPTPSTPTARRGDRGAFRRVRNAVTEVVSPDYFDVAGARASARRVFNESDDAVVVISEAYRRRIFGNASGIGEVMSHTAPG